MCLMVGKGLFKNLMMFIDIGRNIYLKQQEIPIVKYIDIEDIDGVFNPSLPPSTGKAIIGTFGIKIYDIYNENKDYYKDNKNEDD